MNKRKITIIKELFHKEGVSFNSIDDMVEYILSDAIDELLKCSTYTRKKLGNIKIKMTQ